MSESTEKTVGFQLWWAVWLIAAFAFGSFTKAALLVEPASKTAFMLIVIGTAIFFLMVHAFGKTIDHDRGHPGKEVVALITTIAIGHLVTSWLASLFG